MTMATGKSRKVNAHWAALPNLLTYARIVAVPLVGLCFFLEGRLQSSDFARWSALGIFIAASITDFLDGYLARDLAADLDISGACSTRSPTSCWSRPA